MRQVHKDRSLDLVGWFTLLPQGTPGAHILPIHSQILQLNESAVLLGLHTDDILEESTGGGKLPVTIYESVYEVDDATKDAQTEGEDKEMKDSDAAPLKLKFKELPYSVETGEAEMISLDYVAGGAANAVSTEVREREQNKPVAVQSDVKGKRRAVSQEVAEDSGNAPLPKEDEELIAALTSKANAIKMLKSRLDALTKFLEKPASNDNTSPSQTVLRLTQGLVHRLSLVEPSNVEAFKKELVSETNDVTTITLLNDVMAKLMDSRDIGKKFYVVESAKRQKSHSNELGGGWGAMPSAGDLMI